MIFHLYLQIPYLASGIESAEHSADQGISIYCTQHP